MKRWPSDFTVEVLPGIVENELSATQSIIIIMMTSLPLRKVKSGACMRAQVARLGSHAGSRFHLP